MKRRIAATISLPRALIAAIQHATGDAFWVDGFWVTGFWVNGFWVE